MHPFVQVALERRRIAGNAVPRQVGGVVPVVVALHETGMGAPRLLHHGVHHDRGDLGAVRVGAHHVLRDDLLDHHDHPARGEGRFPLGAHQAPDLGVAPGVGALRVHDGDVGVKRRNRVEGLPGEGTGDLLQVRIDPGEVGAPVTAQREEGEARRGRLVAAEQPEMGVLLDFERPRIGPFDRPPHGVQRAHARVAEPAEDELAGGAGGHHLVHEQVRRQAHESEVAPPLADDFVSGGKRDQVGEPLQHDRVPVAYEAAHRLLHGQDLGLGQGGDFRHRIIVGAPASGRHRRPEGGETCPVAQATRAAPATP